MYMVTITDISKKSGYSVSTVSKALNNYSDVSEKVKDEIQLLAKSMGYYPSAVARNLKLGNTYNVGVLLYDGVEEKDKLGLTHCFFAEVLNSFKYQMENHGYDLVFVSDKIGDLESGYLTHCRSKRLDGIFIICADFNKPIVRELLDYEKPIIAFDYLDPRISTVMSDNGQAISGMLREVISRGYENIIFCCDVESLIRNERVQAATDTCNEYGFKNLYFENGKYCSMEDGYRIVKETAAKNLKRPCIMFTDDYAALGGLQAVRDLHINVPQDLAIVGFDGIKVGQMLYPKLTTVQQDSKAIGEAVAQKLLKLMTDSSEKNEKIVIPTKLLIGDTCY